MRANLVYQAGDVRKTNECARIAPHITRLSYS